MIDHEYYMLKKNILLRDKKCVCCGRDYYLQVHHIKKRINGGENITSNLVTLCWKCHDILHNGKTKESNKINKKINGYMKQYIK
jgi:5-methylcytosine-specific restriction endonuclease McrA